MRFVRALSREAGAVPAFRAPPGGGSTRTGGAAQVRVSTPLPNVETRGVPAGTIWYMNALASTEFRKRFARLTERTLVTANGRPIGVWTPVEVTWRDEPAAGHAEVAIAQSERAPLRVVEPGEREQPVERVEPIRRMSQAERDRVLQRVATRGGT